jgi:hypothetical protein
LFEILELTPEVNVVVPFKKDWQVLFLDYSEADILAFKQLDLLILMARLVQLRYFSL